MCGICGYISNNYSDYDTLVKMNNTLQHRGPDDHGAELYHLMNGRTVAFAHRRLSILDLTTNGHQPMHSNNKRISVVFNGEIYNFKELKEQLMGYEFSSECDTEVIIAAYLKWGISFVERINGMFAIALLDRENEEIYLIRDRIGKKPLYYYIDQNKNIVFASELKALKVCDIFKDKINTEILGRYLYRGYITAPDTIYENTYKLNPGGILKITGDRIENIKYWDIASKNIELRRNQITNYQEAKEMLKELLQNSVRRRMISDVPLGAFLSGGYDSSLVCAIAVSKMNKPLQTFSIGFEDDKYNEAPYAKEVAKYLGTDHTELYLQEKDMFDIVDSIPDYYDEPFADSSQIPTMLVSKLAKEKVSVVLSGDGGDELFGGYNIYTILQEVEKRKYLGDILYYLSWIPEVKKSDFWKKRSIVYKILTDDNNPEAKTQRGINTYFDCINKLLLEPKNNYYYEFESKYQEKRYDITRMLLDLDTYLVDDILVKVDRASMRYSLEARCPFLDKDIMEFSFCLLPEFKNNRGNQKRIIKDLAYDYLPQELLERPKAGFAIPLDRWMRGPLRTKIEEYSSRDFLEKQNIFHPEETSRFVERYIKVGDAGKWSGQNHSKIVWAYYMFQLWYKKYA